jgi:hypothetical protein
MRLLRPARRLLVALVAVAAASAAAAPALAQWRLFESDYDEEKKPWKEIEALLPGAPKQENLIPFDPGGSASHRFYIDAPSLSVGEDGVVRYTLVIRTSGGATNTTFEGIRCATQEQKVYAVGHQDGAWVRARDPRWKRIEARGVNSHHGVLYLDFMCPERHVRMVTAKQILASLRKATFGVR